MMNPKHPFLAAWKEACAMFDERWAPLLRLDGASEIEIGNYRRMYAGGFCDGRGLRQKEGDE